MIQTKSRLQGSSVVVTLPVGNNIKPKPNQEYVVVYSEDGTITLVPKINDPFDGGEIGEFHEQDEWHDVNPTGRELI